MSFNTVLTGNTFWHRRYFVSSLIEQSDAQFRLVANACTPESMSEIHEFARRHDDRVVEVLEVSSTAMVAHATTASCSASSTPTSRRGDPSSAWAGRHFYDSRGFVFGSPHFAMYQRAALDETLARWGVGLGSAGPELSDATGAGMAEAGHRYRVYDTGKIANILLPLDGHTLWHFDHPERTRPSRRLPGPLGIRMADPARPQARRVTREPTRTIRTTG